MCAPVQSYGHLTARKRRSGGRSLIFSIAVQRRISGASPRVAMEMSAMKIGLVGLGRMGRAMYARLTENGCEVIAWDRDAGAMKAAAERQMRLADNRRARSLPHGDFVISTITEDHGVRSVFRGKDGFLRGDVKGKLFIEMSTLQPMTGRELAPVVEAAGARLIDSPVFGTIPHVRTASFTRWSAARPEDLERARPVLEKLAGKIAHMGGNGAGYAMKLAVNLGLAAFIQATAESLALGTREGLKLEQMLDILGEAPTANGWFAGKKGALQGRAGRRHARPQDDAQGHHVGGCDRHAQRHAACRCRLACWRRCRPRWRMAGATRTSANWRGSSASTWDSGSHKRLRSADLTLKRHCSTDDTQTGGGGPRLSGHTSPKKASRPPQFIRCRLASGRMRL